MRFSMACALALAAATSIGATAAQAFTFEGAPPSSGTKAPGSAGASGLVGTDPMSALPAVSEPMPGMHMDVSPSSRNNGLAPPPDPRNSVGPGWLYGPR